MQIDLVFIIVLLILALFGVGYNSLVGYLERSRLSQAYTAYLVVLGVLVTLGGAAFLIGPLPALVVLACFAVSGLPMVVGSSLRSALEMRRDHKLARQMAKEVIDGETHPGRVPMAANTYEGEER
jgi:Tfp pilus assembly protein PilX